MSLLKAALLKKREQNINQSTEETTPRKTVSSRSVVVEEPVETPVEEVVETPTIEEPQDLLNDINKCIFDLTHVQIEALTDAVKDTVYFATDGGIYIGGEDGRAVLKSNNHTVFTDKSGFNKIQNKRFDVLYIVRCLNDENNTYYQLYCGNILLATSDDNRCTKKGLDVALQSKQDTLRSGSNIKTINNQSLLGDGNISIPSIEGKGVKSIVVVTESEWDDMTEIEDDALYIVMPDSQ